MNDNPTSAEEQYELGLNYKTGGLRKERDLEKELQEFTKAAEQGHAGAQYKFGRTLLLEEAAEEFTKAAEQGHAGAQYELGEMYLYGGTQHINGGVPRDSYKAQYWFGKAAEQGHAGAQYELGKYYDEEYRRFNDYNNKKKADYLYAKAASQYATFAELGQAEAQYKLSSIYSYINYYEKYQTQTKREYNQDKAHHLLVKAAQQGHVEAQYDLGMAYSGGYTHSHYNFGIHDDKAANSCFFAAAHQVVHCHAGAQFELGRDYAEGRGIQKDGEQAHYWFTEAAKLGYKDAQYRLGKNYANEKNLEKAIFWLTQAAQQDVRIQYELGKIYANGEGVPKDLEKAKYWINLAASKDHDYAKKALAKLNAGATSISDPKCYVATCVYGSYDCPEVWTLRRFRDSILSGSWFGRRFIQIYYATSPKIVELFGNTRWFSRLWKPIIDKIVRTLQNKGIDNNPYSDM